VEPWTSSSDLRAGGRWLSELAKSLDSTDAAVFCITPDNMNSPWLNFEAGALSRSVEMERGHIIPYAIDIDDPSVIPQPLGQFQGVPATRPGTLKMARELFKAMSIEVDLLKGGAFNAFWPLLDAILAAHSHDSGTVESKIETIEQAAIARRTTKLLEVQISPEHVRRGDTLVLDYLIDTEANALPVWLGAAIVLGFGRFAFNTGQDEVVTLRRGIHAYSRKLTLPQTISAGDYDLNAEVWFGPKSRDDESFALQLKWPVRNLHIE
jgi:hypothetical protein